MLDRAFNDGGAYRQNLKYGFRNLGFEALRTVAPASEAMCANFLLMEPPALKSAMVTPPKLHGGSGDN